MSEAYQETNVSTFRLRRRTPGSFLLVPCPKQDRAIRCQGQLEGAAATILAACPQVARIHVQYLEGRLQFQGEPSPTTTKPRSPAKTKRLRHLTAQERNILERRWRAIEPLTKPPGTPREPGPLANRG